MFRDDGRILNTVLMSIREMHKRYYLEKSVSVEEFIDLLKESYLALKTVCRYGGLAEDIVKQYLRELSSKYEIGDTWKWWCRGKRGEIKVSDSDVLEMARNLVLCRFNKVDFDYEESVKVILDRLFYDFEFTEESLKKVIRVLQWLSYLNVDSIELKVVCHLIRKVVDVMFGDNEWLRWIVLWDRKVYSDFLYLNRMILKYEYFVPLNDVIFDGDSAFVKVGDVEIFVCGDVIVVKTGSGFKIFSGRDELKGVDGKDIDVQTWSGVVRFLKKHGSRISNRDKVLLYLNDVINKVKLFH